MLTPTNLLRIDRDVTFEPGIYFLPDGLHITASDLTVDGNGATLVGTGQEGRGISIIGQHGVTIRNITLLNYRHGIYAAEACQLAIEHCAVHQTAELAANSAFLNIWRPVEQAYGGGILLHRVEDALLTGNDLQHQMNGLLAYHSRYLKLENNIANHCSGFGFYFHDTHASLVVDNCADFCCRYQPRGQEQGHMGADSAGFLLVAGSSNNVFQRNQARMCGDGFFLAGLSPDGKRRGCNDNLFEGNDGSYSPNNAFEATFSRGNTFWNNRANHSAYGFWLGFSSDNVVETNQIVSNRQAGLAVENGAGFIVRNNTIHSNGHGILMWSRHVPAFAAAAPANVTCADWLIERNDLELNGKAIRVAANQDHGVEPLHVAAAAAPHPRDHVIRKNTFRSNAVNVEVLDADNVVFEGNVV